MNNRKVDIEAARLLEQVCVGFDATWSASTPTTFEPFLQQVELSLRPELLEKLWLIEVKRLRQAGMHVSAEAYTDLSQEDLHKLLSLTEADSFLVETRDFGEAPSTQSEVNLSHENDGEMETHLVANPMNSKRIGNYIVEEELGRGGMGVVYRARHAKYGDWVALKTLPEVDGIRLHKFKREFRALADISHPNLVDLHSMESDGNQWFFTMALIDGCDFNSFVRPDGILNESRLRSSLSQLVQGLRLLHSCDIIHRDLKPGNVMVDGEGHLYILDFGLISEFQRRNFSISYSGVVGTPAFMAPEQVEGQNVTVAADGYAVGVMLFLALTGKLPFTGRMHELMHKKTRQPAPPLPESDSIPPDLAEICTSLLHRDPSRRLTMNQLLESLELSGKIQKMPATSQPTLLGRDEQLRRLNEALTTVKDSNQPVVAFVSGKSGEGKSSLIEAFLQPYVTASKSTVLAGRCYDRESVPFKALDSLIDALSSYLQRLDGMEAALLLPDDIGFLSQVFPVLRRVKAVASSPAPFIDNLDDQQARRRAFNALGELLRRIGTRCQLIMFIDDIQWGDADSAEVLSEVLRSAAAPNLLLIGSFRSDEVAESPFLNRWNQLRHEGKVERVLVEVKVGPLSTEQCVQMAVNQIGDDTPEIRSVAASLAQEAGGNPFLLSELIGSCDWTDGQFQRVPISEVVKQKIERLSPETRKILEVIAVSGQSIEFDEAIEVVGGSPSPLAAITQMKNERLIRLIGSDDVHQRIDTYHDKIRESIIAGLSVDRRRDLHGDLAQTIENKFGGWNTQLLQQLAENCEGSVPQLPRVYDLAYHFDSSGNVNKALAYGLLAADQARKQYSLDVSTEFYGIARRNSINATAPIRYRLATGCCLALMHAGRYAEATAEIEGAIDLTEKELEKAYADWLQGDLAYKQGQIRTSIQLMEQALCRIGINTPRSQTGLILKAAKQAFVQAVHTMFPGRLYKQKPSDETTLAMNVIVSLTQPYIFSTTLKALAMNLHGMNLAERHERSSLVGQIYGLHAGFSSMLGWQSRGEAFGDKYQAYAEEFDDRAAVAYGNSYYGVGLYGSGQYKKGIPVLQGALKAIDDSGGALYELHLAKFHLGSCHLALGHLEEAFEQVKSSICTAVQTQGSRSMCFSWLWARITLGNFPFESIQCHLPQRDDDVMSTVHALLAEGLWHRFHGRTEESLEVCQRAGTLVWESGCLNAHTVFVLPMLTAAYRIRADEISASDPAAASRLLKTAVKAGKWGGRLTRLFPNGYPLAMRELALVYKALGKKQKAIKAINKSLASAEQLDATFEYAQSKLISSKLRQSIDSNGNAEVEDATRALKHFESMVHRITTGEDFINENLVRQ